MTNSTTMKTVLYFLRLYKRYYVPIFILGFLVAMTQALVIATFQPMFDIFLGVAKVVSKGFIFSFINTMLEAMPFSDQVMSVFVLLISLAIIQSAAEILNDFLISYASGTVLYDIKEKLIRKYSKSTYGYFLNTKQGEIVYNTLMAPNQIAQVLLRIPQIFVEIAKIIAILFVLLLLNPYIALVFIVLGMVFSKIVGYLSKKYTYKFAKNKIDVSTRQNVIFNEFLNGIKQISIYGVKERWIDDFNKVGKKLKNLYIKSNTWFFAPNNLMQLFAFITIFAIVIAIKIFYPEKLSNNLSLIGIYIISLVRMLPFINNLGRRRMEMAGALPDSEKVLDILNSNDAEERMLGSKKFIGLKDSIAMKNVHFLYKRNQAILNGINISFQKNKATAIVGDSGSGKTTLVNLILGLFQPTTGEIMVNGTNLREYDLRSWLDRVGFVSQDMFIYHSTIKENIAFGLKDYSMEGIINAARQANAHEFITQFPEAYDTIVGERGMKLSGGQQQRIAIARAIFKNPEIIILDEASSALDNISEKIVQNAISNISKNRTVIIIAHRLSTVQNADKIVFLKDGVIAEEGSHAELIKKEGLYYRMYIGQTDSRGRT